MGKAVSLLMVGDVMLGRLVNAQLTRLPPLMTRTWEEALPMLTGKGAQAPPLVAGNLECAVTDHEDRWPKAFNFKLSPENSAVLKTARFNFLGLANNHILDYYEPGLDDTKKVLDSHNIAHAGVGLRDEAKMAAYVQHQGLKIGFLSYSDHPSIWAATSEKKGVNFIDPDNFDSKQVHKDLAPAVQEADMVAIFIHWGPNWAWHPSAGIRALGHEFVDAGADVVFGTSSHHVQGIEVYRGKPIIYGAGGFIDDYAEDETFRNDLGATYKLDVEDGKPQRLDIAPIKIRKTFFAETDAFPPYMSQVLLACGKDKQWVKDKVRHLSKEMNTEVEDLGDTLRIDLTQHGKDQQQKEP